MGTHYLLHGKELLSAPLVPSFWRPPTDNDFRGAKTPETKKFWKELGGKLQTDRVEVEKLDGKAVLVRVKRSFEELVKIELNYLVKANGQVDVSYTLRADESLPSMIRVGMTTGITGDFTELSYYGRGPWENYIDRSRSAHIALYRMKSDELYHEYVKPQENGNRTGVRWLEMKAEGKKAYGIRVESASPFEFSVWPYTARQLEAAAHPFDLIEKGFYTLNMDLVQMGVGGNDSWSERARPIEKYRIPAGEYTFEYRFRPVNGI